MKPKITINSLARSNLKHRKKQYTLMFVGILLSMIFSSTAMLFASSMVTSTSEYYKNNFGNCETIYYHEDADDDFYKQALEENHLDDCGFAYILGRIYPEKGSEDFRLNIGYLDEKAKELYYPSFLQGTYPVKAGEIALEKATLEQINPDLKIGDSFTVYLKGQNAETHLDTFEERTYTLVGILRNKRSNVLKQENLSTDFIPTAFVSDGSDLPHGGKEAKVAYVNIAEYEEVDGEVLTTWFDYQKEYGLIGETKASMHVFLSSYKNQFQYSATFLSMILLCLFAVVLFLSSSIGIFNAITSNIADRKKQIGMLRAVGATKRQVRKLFSREAIIISLICTPISLLIAFVAVKTVSSFFGDDFVFTLNIPVLLLSGVFSVICVALASLIPVYAASKISPVQSIRNIETTRKMNVKNIKSESGFNVSNLLAKRNLTFYRRKQAIVSIFLIITIVSSCFGFSALKNELQYINDYSWADYELHGTPDVLGSYHNYKYGSFIGYSENLKQTILNMPYMDSVMGEKRCTGTLILDELTDYFEIFNMHNYARNEDDTYRKKETARAKEHCRTDKEVFPIEIIGLEQSQIKQLKEKISDGKIDINKLNSGQEVILAAPDKIAFAKQENSHGDYISQLHSDEDISDKKEYIASAERTVNVGDTFGLNVLFTNDDYFKNSECIENTVTVSSIIKTAEIETLVPNENICIITTNEGVKNLSDNIIGYRQLSASLKSEYKENMTQELDKDITDRITILTLNMQNHGYTYSDYSSQTDNNLTFTILFLSILSAMALLLAGSMSIINNSLTTRIRESKREMGTLRAVGATQKDLTVSYIRQLLSMFGWGTGIGFGIFFAAYIGIYIYCKVKETAFFLSLSIMPAVIATVIILIVCSLNLFFKIKKETKNSIIDNIREL